jgi:hypothetical protein
MYKRPHHQIIEKILGSFNSAALLDAKCYFAGGTAISLALNEFRESVDIDFLCASQEGYKFIRNAVNMNDLGELLNIPLNHIRGVRAERDKVSTYVELSGVPVKIEIVREGRIDISKAEDISISPSNIALLSKDDLFAQKLLANADRGLDTHSKSRDIIDLAAMIEEWGEIPQKSWNKACEAYGNQIPNYFAKSIQMIHNREHLRSCINSLGMDEEWLIKTPRILKESMELLTDKGVTFPEVDLNIRKITY